MCIKKNDTTERVNTDTTTQPVQCPAFFFFTAGCFLKKHCLLKQKRADES